MTDSESARVEHFGVASVASSGLHAQDRPMAHPYLLTPPQVITVEIRLGDGAVLTVRGTLDAVPLSAGRLAQKLVILDASMDMDVPGHEAGPDQ